MQTENKKNIISQNSIEEENQEENENCIDIFIGDADDESYLKFLEEQLIDKNNDNDRRN